MCVFFNSSNSELVHRPTALDDFAAFYATVTKTIQSKDAYDREHMLIQVG